VVALVAAVISYQHAYELVRSHGESGVTARLLPFTVDGLIWAASMVVLDASRRGQPVPRLAAWNLGAAICATVGANLAHGVGHGPVGALVSAWPALALVGSFELLMMLIRTGRGTREGDAVPGPRYQAAPPLAQDAPLELPVAPALEQIVRARHQAGYSQRSVAEIRKKKSGSQKVAVSADYLMARRQELANFNSVDDLALSADPELPLMEPPRTQSRQPRR
jgi:hypothetical protein